MKSVDRTTIVARIFISEFYCKLPDLHFITLERANRKTLEIRVPKELQLAKTKLSNLTSKGLPIKPDQAVSSWRWKSEVEHFKQGIMNRIAGFTTDEHSMNVVISLKGYYYCHQAHR